MKTKAKITVVEENLSSLEEYLGEKLQGILDIAKIQLKTARKGLAQVNKSGVSHLNYVVTITPQTDFDEKTRTNYRGTLANAIIAAEEDYMKQNARTVVQGTYEIRANFNGTLIEIPQDFWEELIKSYRSD